MYSILSSLYTPTKTDDKSGKPLPSALRPVGKGQTISVALEVIFGALFIGAGIYLLLHHGVDISQIGTVGSKFGYLLIGAPVGVVSLDYVIGSVIKAMKNHSARKQLEKGTEKTEEKKEINEDTQEEIKEGTQEEIEEVVAQLETEEEAEIEEEKGTEKTEEEIKEELTNQKEELIEKKGKLEEEYKTIQKKLKEIESVREMKEVCEIRLKGNETKLAELEKGNASKERKKEIKEELTYSINNNRKHIEDYESFINSSQTKEVELKEQLAKRGKEIKTLKSKIKTLKSKIKTLKSKIEALDSEKGTEETQP